MPGSDAPIMLSLCDRTGVMARPWAEAGYRAIAVDIQHSIYPKVDRHGVTLTYGDVLTFLPPRDEIVFIAAFPPCTDLAVSGAKHMRAKGLRRRAAAIDLFGACLEICENVGVPWMIENPVGILSTHWRGPDHDFHPWHYGGYEPDADDGYTKYTCLWAGGGFVMPDPKPTEVDPETGDRIHKAPPSRDRGDIRSVTPAGFARAVFEANRPGATTVRQESLAGVSDVC